jgi:hypothetical protein
MRSLSDEGSQVDAVARVRNEACAPERAQETADVAIGGKPAAQARDLKPCGHRAKIEAAILALGEAGELPSYLRPLEVRHRIEAWLKQQGCKGIELPSKSTYKRVLALLMSHSDSF